MKISAIGLSFCSLFLINGAYCYYRIMVNVSRLATRIILQWWAVGRLTVSQIESMFCQKGEAVSPKHHQRLLTKLR